jgi:prophage maintenance system killer protein
VCSLHVAIVKAASTVQEHDSQRKASILLQLCVSGVSTERLDNCLDAASKHCFGLTSWHILADASKRVAAGCLHNRVSSMRA